MVGFHKCVEFKLPIKEVYFLIVFSILFIFQSVPAAAVCIQTPTGAPDIAAGTYTGYQMFRIQANYGDSIKVKIPQNADDLVMILYSPSSSTSVCEYFRGNNLEGAGTKTLEYDFPYDDVWYLEISGIIPQGGYQLEVTWTGTNSAPNLGLDYTPHNPTAHDTIWVSANASDPDGDQLTYKWTVDGALGDYSSAADRISLNLYPGSHTIKVDVTDSTGKTVTDTVTFTIPYLCIRYWSGQVKLNGSLLIESVSDSRNARVVPLILADIIETMPENSDIEGMPPNLVEFQYSDGAILKMKAGCKIQIVAGGYRLQYGDTWVKVTKQGFRFVAITPNAVLCPRGTVFEVMADESGISKVNVFEGSVDFTDLDEINGVVVDAGESSTCGGSGIPSDPVQIDYTALDRWYEDMDSDGIADTAEGFNETEGPSTDTDSNGLPDYMDPLITHFEADNGAGSMVMQISNGTLTGCATVEETSLNSSNLPDDADFKWGFIDFTVTGLGSFGSAIVTLQVPEALDVSSQFWVAEQNDYSPMSNSSVDDRQIEFMVSDTDGDGAVSMVGAVGAPAANQNEDQESTDDDEGGGGGCFIATAAYGSKIEPHVVILREFRDRFLLDNPFGRAFVSIYNTCSPPLAGIIADHEILRFAVRWGLLPMVGLSYITLNLGPIYTPGLLLLFSSGLIGLACLRGKFKKPE